MTLTSRSEARTSELPAEYVGDRVVPLEGNAEDQDAIVVAVPYSQAVDAQRAASDLEGN